MFYGFHKAEGIVFDFTKDEAHPIRRKIRNIFFVLAGFFFVFYCIVGGDVVGVTKSIINSLALDLFGKELELPKTEPIIFDMDTLLEEGELSINPDRNRISRSLEYEDCQALYEDTGFTWPESESLKFGNISACVYTREKSGGVKAVVEYDTEAYNLVGIFLIADYTPKDVVLDFYQGDVASSIYETADGEKVYFLRDWRYDIYTVYFVADDVLYQLTIPSTKKDVKNAKEIIEWLEG